MKFVKKLRIILIFVLGSCSLTFSQSLIEQLDDFGYVNWETYVVRSSGIGSINPKGPSASQRVEALENAKQSATNNLLKAVEGLTFSAASDVKSAFIKKSPRLKNLQEVVQHYTIVDTRSMSDMSIEVEIELPIAGMLSALLLPKKSGQGQLRLSNERLCPTCGQPWPEGKPIPEGITLINLAEGLKTPKGTPYTGLIIDVQGLGINPAIAPKIVDEEGHEIYGTNYVDRDIAIEIGMVAYKNQIKTAFNDQRVGTEPLLIRGIRASGALKSDVIISKRDAALIHSAAHIQNFLKKCKVVLVVS